MCLPRILKGQRTLSLWKWHCWLLSSSNQKRKNHSSFTRQLHHQLLSSSSHLSRSSISFIPTAINLDLSCHYVTYTRAASGNPLPLLSFKSSYTLKLEAFSSTILITKLSYLELFDGFQGSWLPNPHVTHSSGHLLYNLFSCHLPVTLTLKTRTHRISSGNNLKSVSHCSFNLSYDCLSFNLSYDCLSFTLGWRWQQFQWLSGSLLATRKCYRPSRVKHWLSSIFQNI